MPALPVAVLGPEVADAREWEGDMTSHEYANMLEKVGAFLKSRPEFELAFEDKRIDKWFWSEKDKFLAAVRALGSGNKETSDTRIHFVPRACPEFAIYIDRSAVCKLVRPAEYDCEPLLSQIEEATLGEEAEAAHGS